MKITRITRFNERVFGAVTRFIPQLSADSKLPDREYFKALLRSKNTHFFILETDNKEIEGMITVAAYYIPTGIKCWIEDVIIDEAARGHGYGQELVKFAIAYSKSLGAKSVRLTSRPSRFAANQLYVKLGFEKYNTNVYHLTL